MASINTIKFPHDVYDTYSTLTYHILQL